MKHTIKLLAFLFIIATALFITACGPVEEEDPTYTVTFDSKGGTPVPSKTGIKSGEAVSKPTDPTKKKDVKPTTPGFYKDLTSDPTFKEWQLNGTEYNFDTETVTKNITLTAVYDNDYTDISLSSRSEADDLLKAVAYIKEQNTRTPTDSWTLALKNDMDAKGLLALDEANIKLTLYGCNKGQTEIKAFSATTNDKVYITVGKTTTDDSIKLTLYNVGLKGAGVAVKNSMVRVQGGATFIMDFNSSVFEHENNIGENTSGGVAGNGSAVSVNGGNLYIKNTAAVRNNKSTGTNQDNRNLVGGVYGFIGKIFIDDGTIQYNECPHTKDIYVTEDVELTINGFVSIGELTLNADGTKAAVIKVPSTVTNPIDKLCLRSSEPSELNGTKGQSATQALTNTKNRWKSKQILQGVAPENSSVVYQISEQDVKKFQLGEFRGTVDFANIANNSDKIEDGFHIETSGTNIGKLFEGKLTQ